MLASELVWERTAAAVFLSSQHSNMPLACLGSHLALHKYRWAAIGQYAKYKNQFISRWTHMNNNERELCNENWKPLSGGGVVVICSLIEITISRWATEVDAEVDVEVGHHRLVNPALSSKGCESFILHTHTDTYFCSPSCIVQVVSLGANRPPFVLFINSPVMHTHTQRPRNQTTGLEVKKWSLGSLFVVCIQHTLTGH